MNELIGPMVDAGLARVGVASVEQAGRMFQGLWQRRQASDEASANRYPNSSIRLIAYQQFLSAAVQLRQQLELVSQLSADPRGALWTWPVYHRAFRQLPRSTEAVLDGMLEVRMLAPASVTDAAYEVATATTAAVEWTSQTLTRSRRPKKQRTDPPPWDQLDSTIVDYVDACRDDLTTLASNTKDGDSD